MATFFVACLTLDTKRQENSRRDIFCCCKVENPSSKNIFGQEAESLRRFYESTYAPFILKKSTAIVVALVTLGIFIPSIYGMVNLELSFSDDALYMAGTAIKDFSDVGKVYFSSTIYVYPLEIFTGRLDYADEGVQQRMNQLFDPENGHLVANQYFKDGTLQSWYLDFRKYGNLTDINETFSADSYYNMLSKFLETDGGDSVVDDIIFDGEVSL